MHHRNIIKQERRCVHTVETTACNQSIAIQNNFSLAVGEVSLVPRLSEQGEEEEEEESLVSTASRSGYVTTHKDNI